MNQYISACNKIIENYEQYISENEKEALKKIIKLKNNNINILLFINKIINRIWSMYLTNPLCYKEGTPFKFLTTRDVIINPYNEKYFKELNTHTNHELEIISEDNLKLGLSGTIVEIDYLNTLSDPILPCDFENNTLTTNVKLNVKGIYDISLGIKNYDVEEECCKDFSEIFNIPLISINKAKYNKDILSKKDVNYLCDTIISYILIKKSVVKDIVKIREELKSKYKKIIHLKYIEYFNNTITLEDLIEYVDLLIEPDINLNLTK